MNTIIIEPRLYAENPEHSITAGFKEWHTFPTVAEYLAAGYQHTGLICSAKS